MSDSDDDGMAAFGAATDQLIKFAEADADQIAKFYRTLVAGDIPAALAKTLTLRFQHHRYGWDETDTDD